MRSLFFRAALTAGIPLLASLTASAHVSYSGRNFGQFTGASPESVTIANQTVASNYGWADATDADFGDYHMTRAFRFTLLDEALVTISVLASPTNSAAFLPGYSVYSGLARLSAPLDHDFSDISQAYLATLPGPPKEGAFDALNTFKMGPDPSEDSNGNPIPQTFADMSTFIFRGYAVDGTAANFGPAEGVEGDGIADGAVAKTFQLAAGNYSIFVGGANYSGQLPTPDTRSYGLAMTVSASPVPEPTALLLLSAGAVVALGGRRNRAREF